MNGATIMTALVLGLACAMFLTFAARVQARMQTRIRQRLGQPAQPKPARRPFDQTFAFNLAFVGLIILAVLATRQIME